MRYEVGYHYLDNSQTNYCGKVIICFAWYVQANSFVFHVFATPCNLLLSDKTIVNTKQATAATMEERHSKALEKTTTSRSAQANHNQERKP